MDMYYRGKEEEVMLWLEQNVPHCHTSDSKRTGFDKNYTPVYGVYRTNPRVYIKDERYATMFILRWA